MTDAERQRRRRELLRRERPETPAAIIDALRKENARLRDLNASRRDQLTNVTKAAREEIERLRQDNKRLQEQVERLRRKAGG